MKFHLERFRINMAKQKQEQECTNCNYRVGSRCKKIKETINLKDWCGFWKKSKDK